MDPLNQKEVRCCGRDIGLEKERRRGTDYAVTDSRIDT